MTKVKFEQSKNWKRQKNRDKSHDKIFLDNQSVYPNISRLLGITEILLNRILRLRIALFRENYYYKSKRRTARRKSMHGFFIQDKESYLNLLLEDILRNFFNKREEK